METQEQNLLRRVTKVSLIIFVFIIIAVIGYIAGILAKYGIDIKKADGSVERFQGALEEPYKKDTYGGKTPEETWAMFLDALKKEDIGLAIQYYAVGRTGVPIDEIYTKKQNGQLREWIHELEGLKKSSREPLEGEANYYYDYFNEEFQQTLSSPVIFYLNPYTKVWKIVSL